ncbi:MAG TPA: pyrroline-5-carboxylate reductase [Burkholderiales bacterium]|nr:pyrroline-5-carboxylate reductase [Burkholderiales bacterium]
MKIAFVGGGNMATALITGALRQGRSPADISVVEIDPAAREKLQRDLKVQATGELATGVREADCIVLAVKPQQMREVAAGLAPLVGDALVISIAAGIRYADLSRWLGGCTNVVRAMPNTPALVLAGMTGLFAPVTVGAADRATAEAIVGAAGKTLWVDTEGEIDAVTAVSGSGPAYVFYFLEALESAAREQGFGDDAARQLALQTFSGAVKLAAESPESAAMLRARVTSKGGTTERAIAVLEERRVREAIAAAVRGAAERSRELGEALGRDEPAGSAR